MSFRAARVHLLAVSLLAGLAIVPVQGQGLLDLFAGKPSRGDEELVSGSASEQAKIALIQVNGIITSASDASIVSRSATPDRLRWQLDRIKADPWVRGVVVEINSPGGEVTASDVMSHMLGELTARHRHVVALLGDIAASGGYYVAMGAERVIAHPTTITGSIGVVLHGANMSGLLDRIGMKMVVLKSTPTPMKDLLSPVRDMTAEERKLLEGVLDSMYDRFVQVISTARKLPIERVRKLADGRIYTAEQARAAGLVDEVGYREDAVKAVMKLAGVTAAKVVRYKRPVNLLESLGAAQNLLETLSGLAADPSRLAELGLPRVMYLSPFGLGR